MIEVKWTEEERAVEADLGSEEIRKRMDELPSWNRRIVLAALYEDDTVPLTMGITAALVKLGEAIIAVTGARVLLSSRNLIRMATEDEMALKVVQNEAYARQETARKAAREAELTREDEEAARLIGADVAAELKANDPG